MSTVVLHIGSNVNDRLSALELARIQISRRIGVIHSYSKIYETKPWGYTEQNDFLNQAIIVETALSAEAILQDIQIIESKMGRMKVQKWGPRVIDIDIIFYNDKIIEKDHLKIPHPEITNRNFVLVPLLDICPRYVHPIHKKTVRELSEECADKNEVKIFKEINA